MQEEGQLKMVNEGLNYDPDEKDWICQFLWTKNSKDILNNFPFALLRLRVKKIVWISLVNHTIKLMMLKSRIILTEVLLRNCPHLTSKNNMVQYITFLITNFKNLNHNLLQSELYLILLHHMLIQSWMTTGLKDWILIIIYLAH